MKKHILILFFASLMLSTTLSYSQTIVKGIVKSVTGIGIPGSTLKIKNTRAGIVTDSLGNYSFKTALRGELWIYCTAISYHTDSILANITDDSLHLDFQLKEVPNELSDVNINVRRTKLDNIKRVYALTDFDIATTAGAVADVAAALQTLPGSAPAGNETGLFVHGGAANETKAFFDGMLVKNPFGSRLPDLANRSRFSAFLFQETAFSTGGYSAKYGGALSSALLLETKDLANTTSTEISIISLGVGAAHTERFKNSSLVVGGNYYNFGLYNNIVKQNTDWQSNPRQYHGMINYKLKTSNTGLLKVFADYSSTSLSFNIRNPNYQKSDLLENTNNNLYVNANYQEYLGFDWKIFAGFAYNHTVEKGAINAIYYDQKDDAFQQKLTISRLYDNNSSLTFGAEQFQDGRDEGYAAINRKYTDVLSAGFGEAEIYLSKRLMFKAGLRTEYSAYLEKLNFSPRTSLGFTTNSKNQFTFAFGTFYQKPDDSFLAQTKALDYEKAYNYTLDYELTANSRVLRVQAYYKDYQDLVKIVTPVFSGFQAYGPALTITDFSNNGKGYAKGLDIFFRDQGTMPGGEFYVSYSYLDTKRDYIDYMSMARPSFAPKSTFNIVARKYVTKFKTQWSATYTYSSGRTYFNPLNPVFLGDVTPASHNLSVGLSYLPGWNEKFAVFNLSVSNILALKQVYGYRYAFDGSRRESVLPPGKRGFLFSFLMNIGDGTFNH